MAAPSVGAVGTYLDGASGRTTAAASAPASVVSTSVVLFVLYKENLNAVSWPTGWTQRATVAVTSGAQTHWLFIATATGTPSGGYTPSWTGATWAAAQVYRIDGADTGTAGDGPFRAAPVTNFNAVTTPATTPPVTLSGHQVDDLVIHIASNYNGGSNWNYGAASPQTMTSHQVLDHETGCGSWAATSTTTITNEIVNAGRVGAMTAIIGAIMPATSGTQTVTPTGITSGEAFGTSVLTPGPVTVSPTGIASGEAFGTAAVGLRVAPSGIASGEAFGTAALTPGTATVSPTGVGSAETFGTATLTAGPVTVSPTGISSSEAFGTAAVSSGGLVAPTGIGSAEAFGTPTLTPGAVTVQPGGIGSGEAFGAAVVTGGTVVQPTSITSSEAFGVPALTPGAVTISPPGVASLEAFGTPTITFPGTDHDITITATLAAREWTGIINPRRWEATLGEQP